MSPYDFDYFVIGAGSAGVRSSRWAASLGAKVGIAEKYRYGGTCVVRGCVPKKMMVNASMFTHEVHIMKQHGWSIDNISHDWNKFRIARETEIERLSSLYQKTLTNNNVTMFNGEAKFIDKNTLDVNGKKITAKYILVAPGGMPHKLNIPGTELTIDSNDFFKLEKRPQEVLIVGGGFIAVEFAGVLKGLGSDVSIAIRKDLILSGFDQSCCQFLQEEVVKTGIDILTKTNLTNIEKEKDKLKVSFDTGSTWEGDAVIMATGRKPDTQTLQLEKAGIEANKNGSITVNDRGQTNVENIFAAGDVIDKVNLTPVALHEGMIIAENLFKKDLKQQRDFDLKNIPSAVFSQPPYSGVGLTEEEARKEFKNIKIYESSFRPLQNTLGSMDEQKTYCKLIVKEDDQRVLGVHMVGSYSSEIIQGFAVAVKMGAKKSDFDQTIGIHPSSAEEFVTMR
tara:strand:- start:121397 stop:122749 length:1353 start_codon:yes stop_codon:yes gene_type:complete